MNEKELWPVLLVCEWSRLIDSITKLQKRLIESNITSSNSSKLSTSVSCKMSKVDCVVLHALARLSANSSTKLIFITKGACYLYYRSQRTVEFCLKCHEICPWVWQRRSRSGPCLDNLIFFLRDWYSYKLNAWRWSSVKHVGRVWFFCRRINLFRCNIDVRFGVVLDCIILTNTCICPAIFITF